MLAALRTIATALSRNKTLRVVLSLFLIWIAFRSVDYSSFLESFLSIQLLWSLLIIFIVTNLVLMITSFRWSLILVKRCDKDAFFQCFKANYIGMFYNQLLPTSNGGDLIKWTSLRGFGLSKRILFASVFVDRFIGIAALFCVGSIALIISYFFTEFRAPAMVWVLVMLGTLTILTLFVALYVLPKPPSFLPNSMKSRMQLLADNRQTLLLALLLSLVSQVLVSFEYVLLGLVWGHGLSMAYMFLFMPLIAVFMLLPISLGGFGSREVVFLYFFTQIGLESSVILQISLSSGIGKIMMALIGGGLLLLSSISNKSNQNKS